MPFATQAQMADGQEELGGEEGGKKINDWGLLLSMVDDEEDNHSSRIKQAKVTYGAVVNFVSDLPYWTRMEPLAVN